MSSKQKRALAALILAAVAGGLAAFAPGVSCSVDEQTIEDLIPDEPSSAPASEPSPVPGSSEASDGGSSGSESSSGGSPAAPATIVAPSGDSGSV